MAKTPTKTDHEINNELFAELTKKAQGSLSQRAFAAKCQISITHLSRCQNGTLDNAPTISFIAKIARCADPSVSFEELLEAAGYDSNKYKDIPLTEPHTFAVASHGEDKSETFGIAEYWGIIFSSLYTMPFISWRPGTSPVPNNNLLIQIENKDFYFNKWLFILVPPSVLNLDQLMQLLPYIEKKTKVSFITANENTFNRIKSYNKCRVNRASAILIDSFAKAILKEEYINRSSLISDDEYNNARLAH